MFTSVFKRSIPVAGAFLLVTSLLAIAESAIPEDTFTPAISGVTAGGTPIHFIKDGFDGTEGPIAAVDGSGSVLFTETKANRITRIAPDTTISTFLENTNGANGLAFNSNGELFAVQTLKTKVGIIYPPGKEKTLSENFEGTAYQRPNDLVLAKNGGIYFTDSGTRPSKENPTPPASTPGVYYIAPDGEVKRLANDIKRPNGIQLSTDEKVLYVANTDGEHILAYDVTADGSIGTKRNFAKLAGWGKTETGDWASGADGLAVDAKGRLYVASSAGIEVFGDKGDALGVIPLPKKPQNLAFAGKDKKTLYAVGRGAAYKIAVLTPGFDGRVK
ncbi:MAG: SMP-30/gluconolactonase/LRE family protein [Methylovulum sp.]|uniref:SMP-30/gluconolactonase/LRE family protein n=1 Tax=Methylovulum sp. TaxID=1916980 RepID=UPI0026174CAB|nr:SMP-30/gluconolactonase/LRE family protein [Methylovulum sp.]MDD2724372.1 SMP-30/gluconolactonase/LRE family protein [Methylovulum sp.]